MGAIGAHHGHSYTVQTVAFIVSALFPGGVLALLAGAVMEKLGRRSTILAAGE
jgi:hypothetical protein